MISDKGNVVQAHMWSKNMDMGPKQILVD